MRNTGPCAAGACKTARKNADRPASSYSAEARCQPKAMRAATTASPRAGGHNASGSNAAAGQADRSLCIECGNTPPAPRSRRCPNCRPPRAERDREVAGRRREARRAVVYASIAAAIPPCAGAWPAKPVLPFRWTATTAGRSPGSPGGFASAAARPPPPGARPCAGLAGTRAAQPSARGGAAGSPTARPGRGWSCSTARPGRSSSAAWRREPIPGCSTPSRTRPVLNAGGFRSGTGRAARPGPATSARTMFATRSKPDRAGERSPADRCLEARTCSAHHDAPIHPYRGS